MAWPHRRAHRTACLCAFASALALPAPAHSIAPERQLLVLTADDRIGVIADDPPLATVVAIAGLIVGDDPLAIALRPQNNLVYLLARRTADGTVQVYLVDYSNGLLAARVSPIGAPAEFVAADGSTPVPVTAATLGIDFDPTIDRIRVVTDDGQNFRLDPNTGAGVDGDAGAPGTQMDAALNGGATRADDVAFTNPVVNATVTTQYVLDSASNRLFIQNPPNTGTLAMGVPITLGGTALDFDAGAGLELPPGLDVSSAGAPAVGDAHAVLTVGGISGLYRLNLASGAASLLGPLDGVVVHDVVVAKGVPSGLALSADGTQLHRFALEAPGALSSVNVTGLAAGERLVGIDFRPSTGQYFGFGVDPIANTGTVYQLDPQPGTENVATPIGAPGQVAFMDAGGLPIDLPSGSYGVDVQFDPAVGRHRMRVVADAGRNFRVELTTGAPVDGNTGAAGPQCDFDIAGGGITGASGSASAGGERFTTLFTLDPLTNALSIQNSPNSGTQTLSRTLTLGGQPLDFANPVGFDIAREVTVPANNSQIIGDGYAVLSVGGTTSLYRIALANGVVTVLGTFGNGTLPIDGLVVPTSTPGPERGFTALTGSGQITFASEAQPARTTPPLTVSGLVGADSLVSIDVRPQNNRLYGLGFDAGPGSVRLYHLDVNGGVALASPVGTTGMHTAADGVTPAPVAGTRFGIDFNPTIDRIRVVTDAGQNFRINPNDGALIDGNAGAIGVQMDGALSGSTTTAGDVAFTDNRINAAVTTEYLIDGVTNAIHIQNPPNSGTLTLWRFVRAGAGAPPPVLDFEAATAFDIPPGVPASTGHAYAVLVVGGMTRTWRIDLGTGIATPVDDEIMRIREAAARSKATNSLRGIGLALHSTSELSRFELDRPSVTVRIAATGLTAGERLVGIDIRPTTGQFYGVGINDVANTGTLYLIDPQPGTGNVATPIGIPGQVFYPGVDFGPGSWGVDFNPTVDRVRVVSDSGLNFRIDPDTGAPVGATPDGAINGAAAGVSATAYTNPYPPATPGSTVTTQYTLDPVGNQLLIQNPPNNGTQTVPVPVTFQGAALDFDAVAGFDIPTGSGAAAANAVATGAGYAALTAGGTTRIFRIDLSSGVATSLGTLGNGALPAEGLVVGAAPAEVALSIPGPVLASAGSVDVTVTRSGGAPLAVNYATESRTAIPGSDYTPVAGTLYFAANEFSKQITIPILPDMENGEGNETFALILTGPFVSGGTIVITISADLVFRNGFEEPPP